MNQIYRPYREHMLVNVIDIDGVPQRGILRYFWASYVCIYHACYQEEARLLFFHPILFETAQAREFLRAKAHNTTVGFAVNSFFTPQSKPGSPICICTSKVKAALSSTATEKQQQHNHFQRNGSIYVGASPFFIMLLSCTCGIGQAQLETQSAFLHFLNLVQFCSDCYGRVMTRD